MPDAERWFRPLVCRFHEVRKEHEKRHIRHTRTQENGAPTGLKVLDGTFESFSKRSSPREVALLKEAKETEDAYIRLCVHIESVLDELVDDLHTVLLGGEHDRRPAGARAGDLRVELALIRVVQQIVGVFPVALLAQREQMLRDRHALLGELFDQLGDLLLDQVVHHLLRELRRDRAHDRGAIEHAARNGRRVRVRSWRLLDADRNRQRPAAHRWQCVRVMVVMMQVAGRVIDQRHLGGRFRAGVGVRMVLRRGRRVADRRWTWREAGSAGHPVAVCAHVRLGRGSLRLSTRGEQSDERI